MYFIYFFCIISLALFYFFPIFTFWYDITISSLGLFSTKLMNNTLNLYSAKLVDAALASGKIWEDEGFSYIKESFAEGTLHLIGLLSDGGVHSRLDQVQVC